MDAETIWVNADGVKIATQTYAPPGPGPHPVLCICHGLPPGPRDPSDVGYQPLAQQFRDAGFAATIFNFRGVGGSEGDLDMAGWVRDLEAVIHHALSLPRADSRRVNLLGFSAGAAISINAAAHDPRIAAVAACACPADVRIASTEEKAREARAHFRDIGLVRNPGYPASIKQWMAGFHALSAIEWVHRLSPRPLLLVYGDRDELVPLRNARLLFERAGEPKHLRIIPGAGHRLRRDPRAVDSALEWLRTVNFRALSSPLEGAD